MVITDLYLVDLIMLSFPGRSLQILNIDQNLKISVLILYLLFGQYVSFKVNLVFPRLKELRMLEPHMMGQRPF